jgi:hypothetical protein
MNLVFPEGHLPRGWRFQFFPPTYDEDLKSGDGVVHMTGGGVQTYLSPFPENSYTISSALSGSLTFTANPGLKEGWLFKMRAGFFNFTDGMSCKVVSVTVDPVNGTTKVFFESYDSFGTGTFDSWTVESDLLGSLNFIQNPKYSAVASKDRRYVSKGQFFWPADGVTNNVIEENTDTRKKGYTELTYKGQASVVEDGYDYNRPYVGITFTVVRKSTLTTVTTTFTYPTPGDPPVENTTTVVTPEAPKSHAHVFSQDDFDPAGPGYYPGNPSGAVDGPTPSVYILTTGELGTIVVTTYDFNYEAWYPTPGGAPQYRIILAITTSRELGAPEGTIDPPDFFPA